MLTDSPNYTAFRKSVETKIQRLTEQAMNMRTSEEETAILKVRVLQLQDILLLTRGDVESLP